MAIESEYKGFIDYSPHTDDMGSTDNKTLPWYEVTQFLPIDSTGQLGETRDQLLGRRIEGVYIETAGRHQFAGIERIEKYETTGQEFTIFVQYHPEDPGIPYTFRTDKSDINFVHTSDLIEKQKKDDTKKAA